MDRMRGVILILMGGFALCRGWTLHTGESVLLAYALGVVSLALGVWRLTRKASKPLR
jgi:hypothetical protein